MENVTVKTYYRLPTEAEAIRREVFMEEQGFVNEFDDIDDIAIHLVAFEDGIPAACCRIFPEGDRIGSIAGACAQGSGKNGDSSAVYILGRLAVVRAARGKGLGAFLLEESADAAASRGAVVLRLHAQLAAAPFYEKNGFARFGKVEYEEHTPHVWMERALKIR